MNKTGFLYDERFLKHITSSYHPERPERLTAILSGIEKADLLPKLIKINAESADMKWIELVHEKSYIERFKTACLNGQTIFDCMDNSICKDTYDTAVLAVGGILKTCDMLMEGVIDNAFCAVRPPGHHAEVSEGMGFCYFNNVAVLARYMQSKWGIKKVGIIDIDVHHGNGTQHIFEQEPDIFYYSIHEHPSFAYPGTGREFETGKDEGEGFTKNNPILPGADINHYKKTLQKDCLPAFKEFKPEVFIISTGFDAHKDDDMSDINLSTEGFSWIMNEIVKMADKYANGRIISVLEGGYSLKRLGELAENHVKILINI